VFRDNRNRTRNFITGCIIVCGRKTRKWNPARRQAGVTLYVGGVEGTIENLFIKGKILLIVSFLSDGGRDDTMIKKGKT